MDAKFHNSSTFKNPGWSIENGNDVNTLLSLDSPISTLPYLNSMKQKWNSSSSATSYTAISSVKETDVESTVNLELGFSLGNEEKTLHNPKKINLQLSLSTGTSYISDIDMYKRKKIRTSLFLDQIVKEIRPALTTAPISSVTCISGITNQVRSSSNNNSIKICMFSGCDKSARRSSGRCISHGGEKRCTYAGCGKSEQGRTDYCKAHRGLVENKRVHGGATLGGLVHENPSAEKMNFENTNVNLMNWKKIAAVSALPISAPEGRVHGGGSFMALLSGPSEPMKIRSNWI